MSEKSVSTAVQLATLTANYTGMAKDMGYIKDDIKELKGQYVTKDEFIPVRNLAYGFAALLLVGVVTALIALVIGHPANTLVLPK